MNHASIAMNLYYHSKGRNHWNCDFRASGLTVMTDPITQHNTLLILVANCEFGILYPLPQWLGLVAQLATLEAIDMDLASPSPWDRGRQDVGDVSVSPCFGRPCFRSPLLRPSFLKRLASTSPLARWHNKSHCSPALANVNDCHRFSSSQSISAT
ncbi:hypothetical protein SAY87_003010 [Trapa incisa]|uniref:Uncharacterized protein n=1 Tax=Trapa incisa TaxID=236973 RepID=A0AAN7QHH5_9MYRT|nr:hypothetical protein SAY87_003010 [Trapa incisa]